VETPTDFAHATKSSVKGDVWLVTHLCPPVGGGGVQRNVKLVKYLSKLGWKMRIVTTRQSAAYVTDNSLLSDVNAHATVTRFESLDPQRIIYLFRRLMERRSGGATEISEGGRLVRVYRALRDSLFFPDAHAGWVLFSMIGARKFRASHPDIVIGSHPVPSCLVLATLLGAMYKVPVVLDLRDGWVDDRYTNHPTSLHRAAHEWLERKIFRKANLIIANTPELAAAIASRIPEVRNRLAVVPNGYDPEEIANLGAERTRGARATVASGGARWIAYVGAIHEDRRKVFCAFLNGLSRARNSGAINLRIRILGGQPEWAAEEVTALGLEAVVRFHPYQPKAKLIDSLRDCDACLVLQPTFDDLAIPGKLYEYLGLGLPVLAVINHNGAAARLLKEVGQERYICASDDIDAITACLHRFAEEPPAFGVSRDVLLKYTRQSQAEEVSVLLSRLVST
jgi:glycosyltransferase involved in cell wall biosynthesis